MVDIEVNVIELGLQQLEKVFDARLDSFTNGTPYLTPQLDDADWSGVLESELPVKKITKEEELILTLALAPYVRPHFIDQIIERNYPVGGSLPHLGGIRSKNHRGFLPTVETALFLLSGTDLEQRFRAQALLSSEHWFAQKQIIHLSDPDSNEPFLSAQLILDGEVVQRITVGKVSKPRFSSEFPASLLATEMGWDDLILSDQTRNQIHEITTWLSYHHIFMNELGMAKKIKPGYRALFYGPPGTGKTLTANLLGKYTSRDVFRIDLSTVISKYIGETEKNLEKLFSRAANKGWILFFDEADALFGKRTQVQNSNDRYANQEVAYLLQRIEDYNGLIILASNLKSNIDDAFIRRFQSIIHFPMPKANERLLLWKKGFPSQIEFSQDIDFKQIAQQYELSGATIMNVVQHVCMNALSRNSLTVHNRDVVEGIRREFIKSGKIC